MLKLIFALIAVAVAVPAGGLLAGVDRRLTARLQSRQGPPLLQPFYDVLKLFGKAPCVTNPWLIFSSYVCLMASAIALLMFFMQGDMLLLFFVMTVGAVFKVAGALSADSPYSNVGAQRELLQMLAYEPLVILTFVGMSAATGSFMISDIYALDVPLLPHLPFLFIALVSTPTSDEMSTSSRSSSTAASTVERPATARASFEKSPVLVFSSPASSSCRCCRTCRSCSSRSATR